MIRVRGWPAAVLNYNQADSIDDSSRLTRVESKDSAVTIKLETTE